MTKKETFPFNCKANKLDNRHVLLITLGHNSSASLVYRGSIVAYEQERLDRIKSSSAFPKDAIEKCISSYFYSDDLDGLIICISHWFDDFNFHQNKMKNKYYDYEYINNLLTKYNGELVLLNENFTHHDAHAYSGLNFLGCWSDPRVFDNENNKLHVLVCDGFGNKQEVVSLYHLENDSSLSLITKISGYRKSLGLMYQYATSFCGMKELQDEYKFLGYESKINEFISKSTIENIASYGKSTAEFMLKDNVEHFEVSYDFINLSQLKETKEFWHNHFSNLFMISLGRAYESIDNDIAKRAIVGFYIQCVLESYISMFIEKFSIKNLVVCGGVFYNVKLNKTIIENDSIEKFCAHPLSGDQGAGLGFLYKLNIRYPYYYNLDFGHRDIMQPTIEMENTKGFYYFSQGSDGKPVVDLIVKKLLNNEIVNLFRYSMEFGPRALCNTTTLALPTKENVEYINSLNSRNTIMPMAPVMSESTYNKLFDEKLRTKIVGSQHFMIVSLPYKDDLPKELHGIANKYTLNGIEYTGRPQVYHLIYDMWDLVSAILWEVEDKTGYGALINTSFNYHGEPIVYSLQDAFNTFNKQLTNAKEEKPINLVVIQ